MKITQDIQDGIALITLDDGKKNAITLAALADLNSALDAVEASADAIVLAGRPGAFCAGFDLKVMTGDDVDAIVSLGTNGARLALRLYASGKPLVAACTGHAFTIGALWLLACAMELLEKRINPTLFVPVVTQSRVYDPERAVQAGFLDELVDAGGAVEAAVQRAKELAQLPARAYAANKLRVRKASLAAMEADLAR